MCVVHTEIYAPREWREVPCIINMCTRRKYSRTTYVKRRSDQVWYCEKVYIRFRIVNDIVVRSKRTTTEDEIDGIACHGSFLTEQSKTAEGFAAPTVNCRRARRKVRNFELVRAILKWQKIPPVINFVSVDIAKATFRLMIIMITHNSTKSCNNMLTALSVICK